MKGERVGEAKRRDKWVYEIATRLLVTRSNKGAQRDTRRRKIKIPADMLENKR